VIRAARAKAVGAISDREPDMPRAELGLEQMTVQQVSTQLGFGTESARVGPPGTEPGRLRPSVRVAFTARHSLAVLSVPVLM
jgi:hypothetical protein